MRYRYDEESGNYVWEGTPNEMAEFYREITVANTEGKKAQTERAPFVIQETGNGEAIPSFEEVERYIKTKSPSDFAHNMADITTHFLGKVYRAKGKKAERTVYDKMYRRVVKAQENIQALEHGSWKYKTLAMHLSDGSTSHQTGYYFEREGINERTQ